jgi:hypothetical protein
MAYEEKMNCKACGREIVQLSGGHRKREYCDDACRQAAHRLRREEYLRHECLAQVQTWGTFQAETVSLLAGLLYAGNEEYARRIASIIVGEQGQHAAQPDQQNLEATREKLAQAARRIEKLERQVEVQRQKLGQYHQRFYPSSLAAAEERLLALGAAVNYKRLLKHNEQTVDIGTGAESWRDFAKSADYDTLALAILQAQRFYENLEVTRSTSNVTARPITNEI